MPYKYVNKLEGKRVLVFGGTSGIGFGIVEAALEHGATVFITGSNTPKLEKTVERLTTSYPELPKERIHIHACDLGDVENQEANIKALLEVVTDGGKTKLNHIAHSAGDALRIIPTSELTTANFHSGLTVRVMSAMYIVKLAPNYVESSPDSSITFTSGVNTTKPAPNWAVQAASGGAQQGFTSGAAVDLAPIRVNCISPGAIKTELFAGLPPHAEEIFRQKTLAKRLGRPEDTAEAYIYCMKDGFLTGELINTNGGYLLV